MIVQERALAGRRSGFACNLAGSKQIIAPVLSAMLLLSMPAGFAQDVASAKRMRMKQSAAPTSTVGGYVLPSKVISGQVRFNKKSDAESSVQLLETIINRIMNIPQVAQAVQLNKTTGSQILASNLKQAQQALAPSQSNQVDYKLAIRPKETGKPYAAPAPALQMIPQNPWADANGIGTSTGAVVTIASAPGAGNFALRQSARNSLPTAMPVRDGAGKDDLLLAFGDEGANSPENWRGNSLTRIPIALKSEATVANADKPGFWDREAQTGKDVSKTQSLDVLQNQRALPATVMGKLMQNQVPPTGTLQVPSYEEARKKAPDLANSINRLYKVTKRMEDLQNAPEKMQEQIQQLAMEQRNKTSFNRATKEFQLIDDRPVVRDAREAEPDSARRDRGVASGGAGFSAGGGGAGVRAASVPSVSRASANVAADSLDSVAPSRTIAMAPSAPAVHGKIATKSKERTEKSPSVSGKYAPMDKLALLPPNVATGTTLPLVSLGNSEAQVIQFLERIGKTKEQKIKNWSVYSWYKKDGDGSVALQLFFRHGLLDAIRIYDSTLIAADFGVAPGDQLESVKERFGEPAFLLPEPGSSSGGKNYIYPISQVGFQLARQGGESPQVVSVLIFSVK